LYNRSQDEDDPERQENDEFTGEVTINLNSGNGEVGGMQFKFKNPKYGRTSDLSGVEYFGFEAEDMNQDPNMFVLKTRETSRKGMGLVGSKRLATSTK
jgi:hypothetical protein